MSSCWEKAKPWVVGVVAGVVSAAITVGLTYLFIFQPQLGEMRSEAELDVAWGDLRVLQEQVVIKWSCAPNHLVFAEVERLATQAREDIEEGRSDEGMNLIKQARELLQQIPCGPPIFYYPFGMHGQPDAL